MSGPVAEVDFDAFVGEHRDKAISLAWRLLGGDRAAAEDVAQESFVRANRGLGSFRGEAKLSTWFYRIVVNEAHRYRRRSWFEGLLGGDVTEDLAAPECEGPDVLLRGRIAQALLALPRGQREAFVLVHLEGFTVREAAAISGRAEGTLKSHLHRALRALRERLADLDPSHADQASRGAHQAQGTPHSVRETSGS